MFNRKSERTSTPPGLLHLCYGLAYYLLPQMLYSDANKTMGYFKSTQFPPGAYLYAMACSSQKAVPKREDALLFQTYSGVLTEKTLYYIVEYPKPPAFDISQSDAVLAPFFSAILHDQSTGKSCYYVLGQRPLGGTTLRTIYADGVNANLGEGPVSDLDSFLSALKNKV